MNIFLHLHKLWVLHRFRNYFWWSYIKGYLEYFIQQHYRELENI